MVSKSLLFLLLSAFWNTTIFSYADYLPVVLNEAGRLEYHPFAARGEEDPRHRLPDFSFAGFRGGGISLPEVPEATRISPSGGDDTARIQQALDKLATLPLCAQGYRGAVVLDRGTFHISDTLRVRASGVVLRGSGQDEVGTVLRAFGPRTVIVLGSGRSSFPTVPEKTHRIGAELVPVGAHADIQVADLGRSGIRPGDPIGIRYSRNQAWIESLGMAPFGWNPDFFSTLHLRTATAVQGDRLSLDIPLVDAIRRHHGGAELFRVQEPENIIFHAGVEHLRIISGDPLDETENRPWNAVVTSGIRDGWVRNVSAVHFVFCTVRASGYSSRITVQDCAYLDPRSKVIGGRRYSFGIFYGANQVLVQRCYSFRGRHDYVTSARVTGPSAFVDVVAHNSHIDCGPHHRWASGILYDNLLTSNALNVENRGGSGTGHGWSGVQHVFWNCEASVSRLYAPPGGMNFCFGFIGQEIDSPREPESSRGLRVQRGRPVTPRSLYFQQLAERLGPGAVEAVTHPCQRKGRIQESLWKWGGRDAFQPSPLTDDLPVARVNGDQIQLAVKQRGDAVVQSFEWMERLADRSFKPAGGGSAMLVLERSSLSDGPRRFFCRVVTGHGPYWSDELLLQAGTGAEAPLASGDAVFGLSMRSEHLGWNLYREDDSSAGAIGAVGPGDNRRHTNSILRFDLPFLTDGALKGARLRIDRIGQQDSGDLTSADLYGLDPRADGFTKIGGRLWHQGTEDRRPFVVFFRPAVLLQGQKCHRIEVDVTDYVRRFYQGSQPLVQSIYFRLSPSEARDVRQAGRLEIYNRPVQEEETGPRPPVLQLWTG